MSETYFSGRRPFDLVHPALRQLQRYDEEHHTEYFETLKIYLTEERSLDRTAAALQIHKNTLLYRIKKLQEHFSLDLDDEKQRLQMLISYYILL